MRKPIKGFENLYEISDDGYIYTLERKMPTPTTTYTLKERCSKGYKDKKGYLRFDFRRRGGKCVPVHRLVAEAFLPNPENKPQVNHINGDKTDNRVENLEWCTNGENQIHAFKFGLQKGAFKHHNSKLTLEQVLDIKNNCIIGSKKYGMQTFAKKYGVSTKSVQQIMAGKSYKYISNSDM